MESASRPIDEWSSFAVRAFQDEYEIPEDGLPGGELPSQTKTKLWLIYETDCDASSEDGTSTEDDTSASSTT